MKDEISEMDIEDDKGRVIIYKTLPDELKNMPRYSTTYIHNLIEDFNTGYRPSDYNDEFIEKERQSYYKEQDEMKAKRLEMQKQKEEDKRKK